MTSKNRLDRELLPGTMLKSRWTGCYFLVTFVNEEYFSVLTEDGEVATELIKYAECYSIVDDTFIDKILNKASKSTERTVPVC